MSTVQHTPGPWHHDKRGYPHPDVKAANGRNVACTWGVNNQPKTKEAAEAQKQIARANARLIAAAPELLDALKDAKELLENMGIKEGETLRGINEAIAKATGSAS